MVENQDDHRSCIGGGGSTKQYHGDVKGENNARSTTHRVR